MATATPSPFPHVVVPPSHPARTLILCFDGTGDSFDADNSNVVQLFSLLLKDDPKQQMVFYQSGIGTYTQPQIATPFFANVSKTLDMMIAWNLDAHVMGGYEFLMQNYQAGDKICLFGFSRGSYTARSLAGMLHKVGLLPSGNHQQVPFAYKMFTRTDDIGWQQSTAFKKAFCMDVDIEFIGVWDTVDSVGLIPKRLPFTSSNTAIKYFRHAVSLDEHRAKFKANLYNRPTEAEEELGTKPGEMPKSGTPTDDTIQAKDPLPTAQVKKSVNSQSKLKGRGDAAQDLYEEAFNNSDSVKQNTDVLEVWFAGCHCDVGGGSVDNSSRHNLARIPLRWMIRQAFLCNTGIRFHANLLRTVGLDPASLYPIVKPRPPPIFYTPSTPSPETAHAHARTATEQTLVNQTISKGTAGSAVASVPAGLGLGYNGIDPNTIMSEEEEDLYDALCPIYDQLKLAPGWWILELVPLRLRYQNDEDNKWVNEFTINLGRPRRIPQQRTSGFLVHRSVKIRMDAGHNIAGGRPYHPKTPWKVPPKEWAD